ncbi:hypothetical protein MA16_Dca005883 [Dendrobium catenatum]|uniref:CCHC-type domain-containing protein n=1 Tax=Dendrobium catenatum TaxID=906689 RepID=A0A2I0WXF8_9ASPA|nr:hypothetical protein MA16_Dca005883 [Dendrobium catenatum]
MPFSVCGVELRRQWNKFGGFHMTTIGMNWILCSFQKNEVVENILNGGPWYVNGSIVGMDRWSPAFVPYSFKGISAPIWIRFPCLPLYCWDEDSLSRIASHFGRPMYLYGNTFRWGKREFARICLKIDLEKKLPNGVWIDGTTGRFFQRVEYEKIHSLCYQCGCVGHDVKECPHKVVPGIKNQVEKKTENTEDMFQKAETENKEVINKLEYGPWIHVHFKNRKFIKGGVEGKAKEDNNRRLPKNRGGADCLNNIQHQVVNDKAKSDRMEKIIDTGI